MSSPPEPVDTSATKGEYYDPEAPMPDTSLLTYDDNLAPTPNSSSPPSSPMRTAPTLPFQKVVQVGQEVEIHYKMAPQKALS